MKLRFLFWITILISSTVYSQEIQGILYDAEGTVPDFEIINLDQNASTRSNSQGFFKIEAKTGDSVVFNSITYKKYILVVTPENLLEQIVVELKIDLNELDVVNLSGSKKEFEPEVFNQEFKDMIKKDREENPYLYGTPNPKGNIFSLVGIIFQKIFPKKETKVFETIKFDDFKELFASDDKLNAQFLSNELKISPELKNFYFDYLDSLSWNVSLLKAENRMDLIQKLYESSDHYLELFESDKI